MKATLNFSNYDMAKKFCSFWAYKTLCGHTMSAKREDGGASVTVYDITDEKKLIIESYVEKANGAQQQC